MKFDFIKMHGIGNDFILMNYFNRPLPQQVDFSKLAKDICQRHFGIGADGLILILPSQSYDVKMRIYNFDGSEAEMCGNGIRCFARYVYEQKWVNQKKMSVETLAGEIIPEIIFNPENNSISGVRVDMGKPALNRKDIPISGENDRSVIDETIQLKSGESFQVTCVSMGNPHCIIFTDDVNKAPVTTVGPAIETLSLFPAKTNVEFIQVINRQEIKFRVWERGVGETMACGTGASAAVVAGVLNKKINRDTLVHLKGGDLRIQWESNDHVYMTGSAETVFTGTFEK